MLSQALQSKVINATKQYEGVIPHMYLDSKGLVTAGVGFYLPSVKEATELAFVTDDGAQATPEQIEQDYLKVSVMEPDRIASFYKRPDSLQLPQEEIDRVLGEHIDNTGNELAGLYDQFPDFPDEVKQALFDMVFNLGITNLRNTWPSFNKAVANQDWQVAAEQSHRRAPVSEARNDYVHDLLLAAANG